MLVIISDIHLTDESTAVNVHPTAFDEVLGPEIIGEFKRVKASEIHLVLLGDIFDMCRTDYWFRKGISPDDRPWGGKIDPKTGMNENVTEIESSIKIFCMLFVIRRPVRHLSTWSNH